MNKTPLHAGSSPCRRSRHRLAVAALGILAAAAGGAAGCGIHWEYDYLNAVARAQEQHTDLVLYFRRWDSPECADVEVHVLNRPSVVERLKHTVNCWIELLDWTRDVADRHGVERVPALVVVRPTGDEQKLEGPFTLEQLLAFLDSALSAPPVVQEQAPP